MLGCATFLVVGGFARAVAGPANVSPYGVVALLMPSLFFLGLASGGWRSSVLDLAPAASSSLYCFSNTMANVPGIVTPIATSLLTPGQGAAMGLGWHAVFLLAAALNVCAAAVWFVGGTADPIPGL